MWLTCPARKWWTWDLNQVHRASPSSGCLQGPLREQQAPMFVPQPCTFSESSSQLLRLSSTAIEGPCLKEKEGISLGLMSLCPLSIQDFVSLWLLWKRTDLATACSLRPTNYFVNVSSSPKVPATRNSTITRSDTKTYSIFSPRVISFLLYILQQILIGHPVQQRHNSRIDAVLNNSYGICINKIKLIMRLLR